MTSSVAAPKPPADAPVRQRSSWLRWAVLAVIMSLLAAGGLVTFLSLREHYRDAPPLSCACGLLWAEPDAAHAHNVQVGPWSGSVVAARPGHVQAFEVELVNRSSVTQTILGGDHNDGATSEPVDVTFARPTGSVLRDQEPKNADNFSETRAVLPPGGIRWVRYAIHTADESGVWTRGRTESFTTLRLRVRIGAWTRWQIIDFDDFAFVLRGQ